MGIVNPHPKFGDLGEASVRILTLNARQLYVFCAGYQREKTTPETITEFRVRNFDWQAWSLVC